MKLPKYSLLTLFKKLFAARRRSPQPAATAVALARYENRDRVRNAIEPLEGRIAPATLLSPRMLTYIDPEGDRVTLTFSSDLFALDSPTLANDLKSVFVFDQGNAHAGAANGTDDVPQQ